MFKKLASNNQVAKPEELITTAKDLGVRLIPCQMTMDLLGLKREDLIDGLEEPIGAATATGRDARRGRLALHLTTGSPAAGAPCTGGALARRARMFNLT